MLLNLSRRETPPSVGSSNVNSHLLDIPGFVPVTWNDNRPESPLRTKLVPLVDPAQVDPILRVGVNASDEPELALAKLLVQPEFSLFRQLHRSGPAPIVAQMMMKLHRLRAPFGPDHPPTKYSRTFPPSSAARLQLRQSFME